MRVDVRLPVSMLALCVLAACSQSDAPATTDDAARDVPEARADAPSPPASGPELTRSTPQPDAGPASTDVIDSQPGMSGSTWELTRARVSGQILTAQFNVRAGDGNLYSTRLKVDQVSLIDDATSERYSVLQDDSGRPMASPVTSSGTALRLNVKAGTTGVVWFRFPAPPADSTTVSLSIPEVGPFDAVPVTR